MFVFRPSFYRLSLTFRFLSFRVEMEKLVKIWIGVVAVIFIIFVGLSIGLYFFQDDMRQCWECGEVDGQCINKTAKQCLGANYGCVKMQIYGEYQTLTVKTCLPRKNSKFGLLKLKNALIEFKLDGTRCMKHLVEDQNVEICAFFDKDFCNFSIGRSITAFFFVSLLGAIFM